MAEIALTEQQKAVVRRYVETWRRWRPGIRPFASLEDDMAKRYEVLVDGIAVANEADGPVIAADDRDNEFYAAIFGDDDGAMPDMTLEERDQARQFILHGEGAVPARKWRHHTPGMNRRLVNLHPSAVAR
jgi:hypothetical protein